MIRSNNVSTFPKAKACLYQPFFFSLFVNMSNYILGVNPVEPSSDYYDLGLLGRKITTQNEAAQIWFNQTGSHLVLRIQS